MIKDLKKALILITQPIAENTTLLLESAVTTPRNELIEIFKVAQEIVNIMAERIEAKKPPSYDEDKKEIMRLLNRLNMEMVEKTIRDMPDVKEVLIDLAEILELLPDKHGLLKLAAHAIRVVSYYNIEEKNDILERLTYSGTY